MPPITRALPLRQAEDFKKDSIPSAHDANRSVSVPATGRMEITIRITNSYAGSLPQPKPQGLSVHGGDLKNQTNIEHARGTEMSETAQAPTPWALSLPRESALNGTKYAGKSKYQKFGDCYSKEGDIDGLSGVHKDTENHGTRQETALSEVRGSVISVPGTVQPELFHNWKPSGGSIEEANRSMSGGYALRDYKIQLMLLEQQNKRRLMMARAEFLEKKEDEDDSDWHDPTLHELRSLELPVLQARLGASQSHEIVRDPQVLGSEPHDTLEQQGCTLSDYERQLMLLEQQNKKRLMLARLDVPLIEASSK